MVHSLGGARRDGSNAERAEPAECLVYFAISAGFGVAIDSACSASSAHCTGVVHHQVKRFSV
jgi:hypothetical protein